MSSGDARSGVSRGRAEPALGGITALVLGGVALALLVASLVDPAAYGGVGPMVLLLAGSALAWVMPAKVGGRMRIAALLVGWFAIIVSLASIFAGWVG